MSTKTLLRDSNWLIQTCFTFLGTGHRRISKVLLQEIGRRSGGGVENMRNREAYALSAGLALGMVVLGA